MKFLTKNHILIKNRMDSFLHRKGKTKQVSILNKDTTKPSSLTLLEYSLKVQFIKIKTKRLFLVRRNLQKNQRVNCKKSFKTKIRLQDKVKQVVCK